MYKFKKKFTNKKILIPSILGAVIIVGLATAFSTGSLFRGLLPGLTVTQEPNYLEGVQLTTGSCTFTNLTTPGTTYNTTDKIQVKFTPYGNTGTYESITPSSTPVTLISTTNLKDTFTFSYTTPQIATISGSVFSPPKYNSYGEMSQPPQITTITCNPITITDSTYQTVPVAQVKVTCAPTDKTIDAGDSTTWKANITYTGSQHTNVSYYWGETTTKSINPQTTPLTLTPGEYTITSPSITYQNITDTSITKSNQFNLISSLNGTQTEKSYKCSPDLTVNGTTPPPPATFDKTKLTLSDCRSVPASIASGETSQWVVDYNYSGTPVNTYYILDENPSIKTNHSLAAGVHTIATTPQTYTNTSTTTAKSVPNKFTLYTSSDNQEIGTTTCAPLTVAKATTAPPPPATTPDVTVSCQVSDSDGKISPNESVSWTATTNNLGTTEGKVNFLWRGTATSMEPISKDANATTGIFSNKYSKSWATEQTNLNMTVTVEYFDATKTSKSTASAICTPNITVTDAPPPAPTLPKITSCRAAPAEMPANTPSDVTWGAIINGDTTGYTYQWKDSKNTTSSKTSPIMTYTLAPKESVNMTLTLTKGADVVTAKCTPLIATAPPPPATKLAIKSCVPMAGNTQLLNAIAPVSGNWTVTFDNPNNETASVVWKNIKGTNDTVTTSTTGTTSTTPFSYTAKGTFTPTIQVSATSLSSPLSYTCTSLPVEAPKTPVNGAAPDISAVSFSTQPFYPNASSGNKTATVVYYLSDTATTTIKILKGTTLIYELARNDSAGTNAFIWTGKKTNGSIADDGSYTLNITASNSNGQDTYTGTDKLSISTSRTPDEDNPPSSNLCAGYKDVTTSDRSCDAFLYAKSIGALTGNADGTLRPSDFLQRDQIAKIIAEALYNYSSNIDYAKGINPFPDVTKKEWSYQYVAMSKANDIITGYQAGADAGFYRPGRYMSRAEFLTIILRAVENLGLDEMPSGNARSYADASTGTWYSPYAKYSKDNSLFSGNYLYPENTVTRREVADILYKLHIQKVI